MQSWREANDRAGRIDGWAFHCHKSRHAMNAMGHNVPTLIGVDHRGIAWKSNSLIPDRMVMGEGPLGSIERWGMFSALKVRRGPKPGTTAILAGSNIQKTRLAEHRPGHSLNRPDSSLKAACRCPVVRAPTPTKVKVRKPSGDHGSH